MNPAKFAVVGVIVLLAVIASVHFAFGAEITIRGITLDCEFVRSLTWVERKLYIVRYEITKTEQRVIRSICKLK